MKHLTILFVSALFIMFLRLPAFADEKASSKSRDNSYCNGTFRGGFYLTDDETFKKMYGKRGSDIYFLEFGCYPIPNFLISGSVGGYSQRGHPIGKISGEQSKSEDLLLTIVPVGLNLGWRFRKNNDQPVVPFVGAGYEWVYIHEDPDPGPPTNGWKQGFGSWSGLLLLLNKLDPEAATYMKMNYSIERTYLELSAKYVFVGKQGELDLRGWMYMIGFSFDF